MKLKSKSLHYTIGDLTWQEKELVFQETERVSQKEFSLKCLKSLILFHNNGGTSLLFYDLWKKWQGKEIVTREQK